MIIEKKWTKKNKTQLDLKMANYLNSMLSLNSRPELVSWEEIKDVGFQLLYSLHPYAVYTCIKYTHTESFGWSTSHTTSPLGTGTLFCTLSNP